MITSIDPATLTLDDLRALRFELQGEDDAVSYVRRIAQARLDLVRARIAEVEGQRPVGDLGAELRSVLGHSLTAGSPRPPRPTTDVEDDPLADELDAICAEYGFSRLGELNIEQLVALDGALTEFERRVSDNRQQRYAVLDQLSAELVRRYRDGDEPVQFE